MVPRASGSHAGAPSPVSAGTKYTPSLDSSDVAIDSLSGAFSSRPSPSRSHCTAAPAMKIPASSAYAAPPVGSHAIVVRIPCPPTGRFVPVCSSRNAPVPYVFLLFPASQHPWPNSAAC